MSIDIVKILIEIEDIDVNSQNNEGFSALHFAAQYGLNEIVESLTNHPCININIETENGWTPLHAATQFGWKDIVKMLLKVSDIDVNVKTNEGNSPLHVAACRNHPDVVQALINHKDIEINSRNIKGVTPLHYASQDGFKKVVKILLKCEKIDIESTANQNLTAFNLAILNGRKDIVEIFLKQCGLNAYCLHCLLVAIEFHQNEIFELCINFFGIEQINNDINDISLIILIAYSMQNLEIIKILYNNGVSLNIKLDECYTLLHIAAKHNNIDFINLLLNMEGVDVNIEDINGLKALDLARRYGSTEAFALLSADVINSSERNNKN